MESSERAPPTLVPFLLSRRQQYRRLPTMAPPQVLTPHATAVVAVLALALILRDRVLATGSPSAATMAQWEPLAAAAAAASVAARAAGRGVGGGWACLPTAVGRVAQLTACSLLLTGWPAAGAWLVAAAAASAALVPAVPAFAPGSPEDAALPATTPAAAASTVAATAGGEDQVILLLHDPAGGSRAAASVAALARFAAGGRGPRARAGSRRTFARLDAARWPEAARSALVGRSSSSSSSDRGPVALPAVVVWQGGACVRVVVGVRAPTSEERWEERLLQ